MAHSVQCVSPIAAVALQDDPCPGATLAFGDGSHSVYGLNLNESHHFFSLTLITFLYISITTTSHPLSISTSSQYLCRVLSSCPNCIINYHSLKTKLPVFCPYHRCWLNSWDECKAEYLVVDEYVKWVSEWVSELWFLRIFSAPGNVLRAEREGDEHDSFITELTAWQYFL